MSKLVFEAAHASSITKDTTKTPLPRIISILLCSRTNDHPQEDLVEECNSDEQHE
jgi:hypothetical protein